MTRKIERELNLRKALQLVVGTHNIVAWDYAFPDPFPAKAAAILANFERMNWSVTGVEEPELTDDDAITTGPVRRPLPTDPIYGPEGPMRGILFRDYSIVKYICDPGFKRRSADVRGHNGLEVGNWWPLQICAFRDGAHGSYQGGIHGTKESGAFSIIVAGRYDQYDDDEGHTLWYSGTMAHDSLSRAHPIMSDKSQAMVTTQSLGRELRVFRSYMGKSNWCPTLGIRYGGLYIITVKDARTNEHGGTYPCFRLDRLAGQPAINMQVPTAARGWLWRRVKDGY